MTMGLNPITLSTYTDFAVSLFEDYGKHPDRELVSTVYNMYKGCTWFVQMIMNELFSLTPASATCTPAFLPEASSVQSAAKGPLASDVITRDNDTYRIYDYFLSQWLATMY